MKRAHLRNVVRAGIILLTAGSMLHAAEYTEIRVDGNDGWSDVSYTGGTLTYASDDANGAFNTMVLKEDTGTLPGDAANIRVGITTDFQDYNESLTEPARALFTGGLLDLVFDYSPDGGSTITSHQLRGAITQGSLEITAAYEDYSTLTGIFQFDTNDPEWGVENLPGSNNWPAPGVSTSVALTFAIGADLSQLKDGTTALWQAVNFPEAGVTYDTSFSFFPEERPIPEPTSLLLAALGALALLRRPF